MTIFVVISKHSLEVVFFHPAVKGGSGDPQVFCCLTDVAGADLNHALYDLFFDRFQIVILKI